LNGVKVKCAHRKGLKILKLYLFADFNRNYILINDIILIYELVGVKVVNEIFSNANKSANHERDFACTNSISVSDGVFLRLSTQRKIENSGGCEKRDITRLTGGYKISFFALFSTESTLVKAEENPYVIRFIKAKMMIHSEIKGGFLKYSPGETT
jgi:hypothetical protein